MQAKPPTTTTKRRNCFNLPNQFKPGLNCTRTISWSGLVQIMIQSQSNPEGLFCEPVHVWVHKKLLQDQTEPNHGIPKDSKMIPAASLAKLSRLAKVVE